jgi:hypothetical protein
LEGVVYVLRALKILRVIILAVVMALHLLLVLIAVGLWQDIALSHGVVVVFMYGAWTVKELLKVTVEELLLASG